MVKTGATATAKSLRSVAVKHPAKWSWDGKELVALSADMPAGAKNENQRLAKQGHSTRFADVLVPARFVSFRNDLFPDTTAHALRAAARLRGQRHFAHLGAVIIDAIIAPAQDAQTVQDAQAAQNAQAVLEQQAHMQDQQRKQVQVLLMALPQTVMAAIQVAVADKQLQLRSLRVDVLQQEIPRGGLVQIQDEATLLAQSDGVVRGIAVLGSTTHPQFPALLARERERLQVKPDAPSGYIINNTHNFSEPSIERKTSLAQHKYMRVSLLGGCIVLLLVIYLSLSVSDIQQRRNEVEARLQQLRPIAAILSERRKDLKESAAWFDQRPQVTPLLFVVAESLPALSAPEQVYVSRIRQVDATHGLAEGVAGDRGQLLNFIQRLRQQSTVAEVDLRSSRKQDKLQQAVTFELIIVMNAGITSSDLLGATALATEGTLKPSETTDNQHESSALHTEQAGEAP